MSTLHEQQYTFLITSRSVLLKMTNVSNESCRGNQNTHFMKVNFFSKIVPFFEIMWKNSAERGRSQMVVWRMRIVCWIPKAANINSQCVILTAFPLRQLLHECASKTR